MANAKANYDYSDAKVLVTGGSNGIGFAIASAFAAAGADVLITGTRAKANDYDNDLSAFDYQQLEVKDRAAIETLADNLRAALDQSSIPVADQIIASRVAHKQGATVGKAAAELANGTLAAKEIDALLGELKAAATKAAKARAKEAANG